MPQPLHVLIVEDSAIDAAFMVQELRRAGFDPEWRRVETEAEFVDQLVGKIELILSDYSLPRFSGLRALELLRECEADIPFILVSGVIGEEAAVAAIKRGAADYLMKDRLGRLGTAVTQALAEFRLRREHQAAAEALRAANQTLRDEIADHKRTEEALRISEERFREIAETIEEVFWVTDPEKNRMLYISPAYEKIWGRTRQSLTEAPRTWFEAIHPADRERVLQAAMTKPAAGTYDEEYRILRPDGAERWIRDRAFPVRDATGVTRRVVGVAEDITESKRLKAAAAGRSR